MAFHVFFHFAFQVKYQYEVYPKTTKQASRQVLLVQEVEIRDRMATSQINKFLYQYSSSSRPKQSNAYMVNSFFCLFFPKCFDIRCSNSPQIVIVILEHSGENNANGI